MLAGSKDNKGDEVVPCNRPGCLCGVCFFFFFFFRWLETMYIYMWLCVLRATAFHSHLQWRQHSHREERPPTEWRVNYQGPVRDWLSRWTGASVLLPPWLNAWRISSATLALWVIYLLLTPHADRHAGYISFTVLPCLIVRRTLVMDISGMGWRRAMKFCRVVNLGVHQVISPSGELWPRG